MTPKAKDCCNPFSVNEREKENQREDSKGRFIKLLYFLSVGINEGTKQKKRQNLGKY
jgi:hypothetical protein